MTTMKMTVAAPGATVLLIVSGRADMSGRQDIATGAVGSAIAGAVLAEVPGVY